jgi:putative membrane protein
MRKLFIGQLMTLGLVLGALAGCGDDDDSTSGSNGGTAGHNGGGTTAKGGTSGGGTSGNSTGGTGTSKGGTNSGGGTATGGHTGTTGGAGGASGAGAGGESGGGVGGGAGGVAGSGAGGEGGLNVGGEGGVGAEARELSDAEIFKVLDTLNAGEVAQANAALPKLMVTGVAEFAQMMVTEHTQARADVQTLAETLGVTPTPNSVDAALKAHSDDVVATFLSSQAAALDSPYVMSQVAAHRDALKLIAQMQSTANATELKQLLATLRASVQTHYQLAVQLQAQLETPNP